MAVKPIIKNAKIKRAELRRMLQQEWPAITNLTKIRVNTTVYMVIPGEGSITADRDLELPGEKLTARSGPFKAGYNETLDTVVVVLPYVLDDEGYSKRLEVVG
jgi:hypothetical protein